MGKRREYTPEYKARIVIEVLREESTMSEIAAREELNVKQLGNWKTEFLGNAGRAFSQSRDEKAMARQVSELQEKERDYQAKVGQLTLEVDFLKKSCDKLYGSGWKEKYGYKG